MRLTRGDATRLAAQRKALLLKRVALADAQARCVDVERGEFAVLCLRLCLTGPPARSYKKQVASIQSDVDFMRAGIAQLQAWSGQAGSRDERRDT